MAYRDSFFCKNTLLPFTESPKMRMWALVIWIKDYISTVNVTNCCQCVNSPENCLIAVCNYKSCICAFKFLCIKIYSHNVTSCVLDFTCSDLIRMSVVSCSISVGRRGLSLASLDAWLANGIYVFPETCTWDSLNLCWNAVLYICAFAIRRLSSCTETAYCQKLDEGNLWLSLMANWCPP